MSSIADWVVLVVEDDPDSREVVSRMLHHYNITVDVAANAEDALDLAGKRHYTVAIIDLALPKADGWQLLKMIRAGVYSSQMPCIAVTAFHSADVAVKAIKAGFMAYFPKPIDPASFVKELARLLP